MCTIKQSVTVKKVYNTVYLENRLHLQLIDSAERKETVFRCSTAVQTQVWKMIGNHSMYNSMIP